MNSGEAFNAVKEKLLSIIFTAHPEMKTKEFDEMMEKWGNFESVIRGIQIVGVPYAGPILDKQNDDDNLFALMNTASYLAGGSSDTRWWEESFSELPPTERKTFHACIYVLFSLAFNSEEVKK